MTKEEKEAIEKLKWYFKDSKSLDIAKQTDTVLNLIQKQQVEIEKSNQDNKKLDKQAQEYFETIMLKDKIIEELEDIFYNYQLCEYEITDCTYRKCEDIADDKEPPCKQCIKQYFEKKVEESK